MKLCLPDKMRKEFGVDALDLSLRGLTGRLSISPVASFNDKPFRAGRKIRFSFLVHNGTSEWQTPKSIGIAIDGVVPGATESVSIRPGKTVAFQFSHVFPQPGVYLANGSVDALSGPPLMVVVETL